MPGTGVPIFVGQTRADNTATMRVILENDLQERLANERLLKAKTENQGITALAMQKMREENEAAGKESGRHYLLLGGSSIYTGIRKADNSIGWSSMSEVVQTTLINHEDNAEVSTICKWGKGLTHFTTGLRFALVEKGQPFDVVVISYSFNDRIDFDANLPITRGQDEDFYISENVALAEALCSCANRAIVLLGGESYFTENIDREEME